MATSACTVQECLDLSQTPIWLFPNGYLIEMTGMSRSSPGVSGGGKIDRSLPVACFGRGLGGDGLGFGGWRC